MSDSLKDLPINEQIKYIKRESQYFSSQDRNILNSTMFEVAFSNPTLSIDQKRELVLDFDIASSTGNIEHFKTKYEIENEIEDNQILDPLGHFKLVSFFIFDNLAYSYESILALSEQIDLNDEVSEWIDNYQRVIYLIVNGVESFEEVVYFTNKPEIHLNDVFAPGVYLKCQRSSKVFINNGESRMAPAFTIDGNVDLLHFSNKWLCDINISNKIPIVKIENTVLRSLNVGELSSELSFSNVEFDSEDYCGSTKLYKTRSNKNRVCDKLTIHNCTFRSTLAFDKCKIKEVDIIFSKYSNYIDLSNIISDRTTLENKCGRVLNVNIGKIEELTLKGDFYFASTPEASQINLDDSSTLRNLVNIKYTGTVIYRGDVITL